MSNYESYDYQQLLAELDVISKALMLQRFNIALKKDFSLKEYRLNKQKKQRVVMLLSKLKKS